MAITWKALGQDYWRGYTNYDGYTGVALSPKGGKTADDWIVGLLSEDSHSSTFPVDRWIVRHYTCNDILAYADTAAEAKQIAELMQSEIDAAKNESLPSKLLDSVNRMQWTPYTSLVYKFDGTTESVPCWEGTGSPYHTVEWVVKRRNLSPTINRWSVRRWGKPDVLAYAETADEAKEIAELMQREANQVEESACQVVDNLLQ